MKKPFNRRSFLKHSSIGALAAATPFIAKGSNGLNDPGSKELKIQSYRTLGRTGFQVSDISIGCPQNESALKAALLAGMNFIDTAHHYANGNNERRVGKIIKGFDRDKIFVNTKMPINVDFSSTNQVVGMVRGALERLDIETIDCMMIHGAQSTAIIKNKYFHEGLAQMKAEGRVKHLGVSCHGAAWNNAPEEDIEKILMTAVEDGRFDVISMVYNLMNEDKTGPILRACKEQNIGTVVYKTSPFKLLDIINRRISDLEKNDKPIDDNTKVWHDHVKASADRTREYVMKYGFKDEDQELANACMQYAISNPDVHTCLTTIKSISDVERWVPNSGKTLSGEHIGLLDHYNDNFAEINCRIGCTDCASVCPHNVPVSTIMRYNYYFENKGEEKSAMQKYASIKGNKAEICQNCEGYCESACSYGVMVRPMIAMAHENLQANFS